MQLISTGISSVSEATLCRDHKHCIGSVDCLCITFRAAFSS